MAERSKSSQRWLKEHFSDPYVKKAHEAGYRSRAIFKLLEIHQRDHLFKPGMTVIDLGAAPGSWSEQVVKWVKPKGRVIALDILAMEPIEGVEVLQGDFTEDAVLDDLLSRMGAAKADWVLSDIAPNMTGHEGVDIPRQMYVAELALDFALRVLNTRGGFLVKVFQGEGFEAFVAQIKSHFSSVVIRKPKASRGRSREIFILARQK